MKELKKPRAGYNDDSYGGFEVSFVPNKSGTFYIDILRPILSADMFSDAIQVLNLADEDSDIIINLQTPGGELDATDRFIHALRRTKANVHMIASGTVASAGTLILLEAASFELTENMSALLHCGSLGHGGNYNEYVAAAKFYPVWMGKLLRNSYEGFLSEEEIEKMLGGGDIYLTAQEWMERAEMRNEYFKAKYEAMNAPPKRVRKKPVPKTQQE